MLSSFPPPPLLLLLSSSLLVLLSLATAALQARLRTKVGQSVDSAGSAAIPSQLVIMATASRGVKPNTRRLHGVIRQSFEVFFSRFISWTGASPPHRLTALLVVFRVSAAVSRAVHPILSSSPPLLLSSSPPLLLSSSPLLFFSSSSCSRRACGVHLLCPLCTLCALCTRCCALAR